MTNTQGLHYDLATPRSADTEGPLPVGDGRAAQRRRLAVAADAVASAGVGIPLLVGAAVLDDVFGESVVALAGAGAVMVAWAAALAVVLRRPISVVALRRIVGLNAVWVGASALVLAAGWSDRTAAGNAGVIAQAVAVAALAEVQLLALRASRG